MLTLLISYIRSIFDIMSCYTCLYSSKFSRYVYDQVMMVIFITRVAVVPYTDHASCKWGMLTSAPSCCTPSGVPSVEAETFWVPADAQPTTFLERMAKSIYDLHTSTLSEPDLAIPVAASRSTIVNSAVTPTDQNEHRAVDSDAWTRGKKRPRDDVSERSGAEWWIQIRKEGHHSDLGMPFHWDKDERLLEVSGEVVHPTVSTVTYLTDYGAPTVVLEVTIYLMDPWGSLVPTTIF